MRRVEYWETEEECKTGKHYRLIVESTDESGGYSIEGRLLGSEEIESIYCDPLFSSEEKTGIFDMMRDLYWKIKEVPELGELHRRMCTLSYADSDTARTCTPGEISLLYGAEKDLEIDKWYSRSMKNLTEAIGDLPASGEQLDLFG